jgi:hypothetical protein
MVKGRINFLSREKNERLQREITTLYMPSTGSTDGFYKLERDGRVVVKARKKSLSVKRTKLRKMQAGHGKKDAYLETVRILAGRDKSIL